MLLMATCDDSTIVTNPPTVETPDDTPETEMENLHDFTLTVLDSDTPLPLADFAGKKVLVVNTASECGYTPQYAQLQELYEQYSDQLVILGCPCNQFGGQELGTEHEIATFCQQNYGVTFPLSEKLDVKGPNADPLYAWITSTTGTTVNWNFQKYLFDENGNFIELFSSSVNPLSEQITSHLD